MRVSVVVVAVAVLGLAAGAYAGGAVGVNTPCISPVICFARAGDDLKFNVTCEGDNETTTVRAWKDPFYRASMTAADASSIWDDMVTTKGGLPTCRGNLVDEVNTALGGTTSTLDELRRFLNHLHLKK